MATPVERDIEVWRGSQKPILILIFKNPDGSLQDLNGHEFVFQAIWAESSITKTLSSNDGLTLDLETAQLTVRMTKADTRSIPSGQLTSYSVEHWYPNGDQEPAAFGLLTGRDYPNND